MHGIIVKEFMQLQKESPEKFRLAGIEPGLSDTTAAL